MKPLLLLIALILHYHSPLLEKMVAALDAEETIAALDDGTHFRSLSYAGYPLTVRKYGGKVGHIGFSMFDAEDRAAFPVPVLEFMERYPLELMLGIDEERSPEIKMFEDGVEFLDGNMTAMLKSLCADSAAVSKNLDNILGKRYCFQWSGKAGKGRLVFPIDWQLISGRNMMENEDALPDDVRAAGAFVPRPVPEIQPEVLADGIYVYSAGCYYLESLASNRYYISGDDGKLALLNNPDDLKAYTANLFTGSGIPNVFTLAVKIRKYGFKSSYFTVSFDQWLSFCLESGCTPFWGIVSVQDGVLTGEWIMHNEDCGYDHVLRVVAPLETLRNGKGEIRCRLVPYIPLHSLRYLFEETKS